MFRKFVVALLLVCCLALPVFADQRLYDGNSREYVEVRRLCQVAGVVGPSSALPVNGDELIIALDRIDASSLSPAVRKRYDELYSSIAHESNDSFRFAVPLDFSPQFFFSTNQKGDRKDFFVSFKDERPLMNFGLEMFFTDYAFMETAMPLRNISTSDHIPYTSFDFFYDEKTDIFHTMPIVARGSFGNNMFSLYLGRTRHSMGNGFTGNMIVGDNYEFQEVLNAKFTSNYFSYNMDLTHFDTQTTTTEPNDDDLYLSFESAVFDNPHIDGKQQSRVVHRFDINLVDRVRFVINLGTVYYGSSSFDPRWFFPFMIFHSFYNYSESFEIVDGANDEANNIMGLEIEYPIIPKLNLSLQIVMDQFQIPSREGNAVPNAFGALVSLSYVEMTEKRDYEGFIEFGMTSPYLYFAPKYKKGENGEKIYNWNYDYYLGYYSRQDAGGDHIPSSGGHWSGYGYGPNSLVVALGFNFLELDWDFESKTVLSYILKGSERSGLETFYVEDKRGGLLMGPYAHTLKLREDASYFVLDSLELLMSTELSYIYQNNKHDFDAELYFGLTWHIM